MPTVSDPADPRRCKKSVGSHQCDRVAAHGSDLCEVCGGKDIRISGGANLVRQYVNAGVVDELVLSVAPTFLGGKRLFDGIEPNAVGLEILEVLASPSVTHLRYAVKKKR